MHSAPLHSDQNQTSLARFGLSHGYRLEGDSALLNAHIDLSPSAERVASSFALQLWACEEPYRGGPLSGFKIAEAPITLFDTASRLDAVAFAHPPAAALTRLSDARDSVSRDFSMVLVLAAGAPGAFNQVHDFANYPARERFVVPHLDGAAGYKLHDDGSVSLHVGQVINPRSSDNLSGSLSLQLWAADKPYAGGELNGTLLATRELGQVRGQESIAVTDELRSTLTRAVNGASHLVLALCEWTALGYLARDYCNFSEPQHAAGAGERAEVPAKVFAVAPSAPAEAPAKVAPAAPSAAAEVPFKVAAAPSVPAEAPAKVAPAAPSVAAEAPAKVAPAAPSVAAAAPAKVTPAAPAVPAQAPVKVASVAPSVRPEAAAPAALPPSASAKGALPSLNAISEDELVTLAGISKKLAGQILKGRPYKSLDELRSVRGIGDKTVFSLRKLLTV